MTRLPTPFLLLILGALLPSPADAKRKSAPVDWIPIPGRALELVRSEVTVAQYQACVDAKACTPPGDGDGCPPPWDAQGELPVTCVTQEQAEAFAAWVGGRLPTKPEWQHAALGGQLTTYAGSENLDAVGWYDDNSPDSPQPVCTKQPNGFGLCDMSGNVAEWTATVEYGASQCMGGAFALWAMGAEVEGNFPFPTTAQANWLGFRPIRDIERPNSEAGATRPADDKQRRAREREVAKLPRTPISVSNAGRSVSAEAPGEGLVPQQESTTMASLMGDIRVELAWAMAPDGTPPGYELRLIVDAAKGVRDDPDQIFLRALAATSAATAGGSVERLQPIEVQGRRGMSWDHLMAMPDGSKLRCCVQAWNLGDDTLMTQVLTQPDIVCADEPEFQAFFESVVAVEE
jgi:hypothetical protein